MARLIRLEDYLELGFEGFCGDISRESFIVYYKYYFGC